MADKLVVKIDPKQVLATPIDRGSFVVKNRELLRVHFNEDSFTQYFKEANGEVSETHFWDAATKAAFAVFINITKD